VLCSSHLLNKVCLFELFYSQYTCTKKQLDFLTFWLCTYYDAFSTPLEFSSYWSGKQPKLNGTLLQSLLFIIFVYSIMSQHLEFTNIVLPIGGSHKGHIHYSSQANTPCPQNPVDKRNCTPLSYLKGDLNRPT